MNKAGPPKRYGLWTLLAVSMLLAGGLVVFWRTNPQRGDNTAVSSDEPVNQTTTVATDNFNTTQTTSAVDIDPDDYIGEVPPGVELEGYPRLVPWDLDAITTEDGTTMLTVQALSYACNLSRDGPEEVTETFHHVEVHETAHTVTIETWLGPPEGDGFWPGCEGTGWGFPVVVGLDSPIGDRELVDPACELDRYSHLIACEHSKLIGLR